MTSKLGRLEHFQFTLAPSREQHFILRPPSFPPFSHHVYPLYATREPYCKCPALGKAAETVP